MSAYPVGTVAIATVRGIPGVRAFRYRHGTWVHMRLPGVGWGRPGSSEYEEGVTGSYYETPDKHVLVSQVEMPPPVPPKPPEPTGLGAVVEDERGQLWTRHRPATNPSDPDTQWFCDNPRNASCWDRIDAVHVLSDGVQP